MGCPDHGLAFGGEDLQDNPLTPPLLPESLYQAWELILEVALKLQADLVSGQRWTLLAPGSQEMCVCVCVFVCVCVCVCV